MKAMSQRRSKQSSFLFFITDLNPRRFSGGEGAELMALMLGGNELHSNCMNVWSGALASSSTAV